MIQIADSHVEQIRELLLQLKDMANDQGATDLLHQTNSALQSIELAKKGYPEGMKSCSP